MGSKCITKEDLSYGPWGFKYKTNLIWHKITKDGGPDGRGVDFILETQQKSCFCTRGSLEL